MVVFDKDLTLSQKMMEYDKPSLKGFASDLGLRKLSQLNKTELVELIVGKLLDPEILFYRVTILSDKAIKVFEKGFNGPYTLTDDEFDNGCILNEMDLAVMSRNELVIPCDVVDAWNKINDEKFQEYRKKAFWVWKCIHWAEKMYAYTPVDIMLEVINNKKGMRITAEELKEIFFKFPEDQLWSLYFGEFLISSVYASDSDALESIRYMQADKDYYIPTVDEVEELFDTGALISDKAYQEMLKFITKDVGLDRSEAEDILYELWDKVAIEDDPHETMQWFWNQFELDNGKQVEKIVSLYMPIANGTRMQVNRGHKPSELHSKSKFGPGKMPVITAGSSRAAEMLAQTAPQIQQMGFGLDLDSNAGRVPVIGFPNGLNGETVVSEKKIYPNDPCPCGSDKKYKKCCGKK